MLDFNSAMGCLRMMSVSIIAMSRAPVRAARPNLDRADRTIRERSKEFARVKLDKPGLGSFSDPRGHLAQHCHADGGRLPRRKSMK
jgi:hypothetical protein